MQYPTAIDPNKVGEYDEAAYSGGGYFFDEVLEYRVWCYADKSVKAIDDSNATDSYRAFATYQQALAFADNTQNAESPVALVRQLEWIDQPSRGVYIHSKGERITEWQAEWLHRGTRKTEDITEFLQKHAKSMSNLL